MKNLRFCFLLITISSTAAAHPTQKIEEDAKKDIQTYLSAHQTSNTSLAKRIGNISGSFVNKPYLLNPLGEGIQSTFNQKPLFRTDAFDCLTYIETVLAMTIAQDYKAFKSTLQKIRYTGPINFINRNHFTGLDWNTNVEKQGILLDITKTIKNQQHQAVFLLANAAIDKRSWYQHLTSNALYLPENPLEIQAARLKQLRQAGSRFEIAEEVVPYIPLAALFNLKGTPNRYLFNQIPDKSIIEIVRPNWNLTEQIGTHLNISHIGFLIKKKNQLFFRDASSTVGKVSDRLLIPYLRKAMLESPTIKGINIHIIQSK